MNNPCNSNINITNARAMAQVKLSIPRNFVNKMSRENICSAFKRCKDSNLALPPMKSKIVGDKRVYYSSVSPILAGEYMALFASKPNANAIKKIAMKLGIYADSNSATKKIKVDILDKLSKVPGISEPIVVPKGTVRAGGKLIANNSSGVNNGNGGGVNNGNRKNNGGGVNNGNRKNNMGGNRANNGNRKNNGGANNMGGNIGNRKNNGGAAQPQIVSPPAANKPKIPILPSYGLVSGLPPQRIVGGGGAVGGGGHTPPVAQKPISELNRQKLLLAQKEHNRKLARFGQKPNAGTQPPKPAAKVNAGTQANNNTNLSEIYKLLNEITVATVGKK
jgi:hypothetical protein